MSLEVGALPSPTGPFSPTHNMNRHSFETPRTMPDACSSTNSKVSASSRFKDLVRFLSSVSGDLSNVTAPPFFLAPSSVVEVGHCWSQRPGVFAAPALEPDAAKRSLLVLRMILIAMRSQFYVAGSPSVSIKKPLNAFLGELFLASWTHVPTSPPSSKKGDKKKSSSSSSSRKNGDGLGLGMGSGDGQPATTRLVAEQVSHHPPITAMAIVDEAHGIRADGYARVEMTFSSSVDIKQVGHAIVSIDRYHETYLVPLPDVKVRGFLSGRLYPEVLGTYTIVSSSGYVSEMTFTGAGVFRGKKNTFEARLYRKDDPRKTALYEVAGVWSEGWTVKDSRSGEVLERYDVDAVENRPAPMDLEPLDQQDPWESRRAWAGVIDALGRGDFRDTVAEKSKLEQAQRRMRAEEKKMKKRTTTTTSNTMTMTAGGGGEEEEGGRAAAAEACEGKEWEPLFFKSKAGKEHTDFHRLAQGTSWKLNEDKTKGVWRVDDAKIIGGERLQKPFRGQLTPLG